MTVFLTVADFCRQYRVSRSTFYRERNAGRIRTFKVGRATRIKASDAEDWAAGVAGERLADGGRD